MKTIELLAVVALLGTFAFAEERNPNIGILAGNPIYHKSCAKCHGKNAEGRRFSSAPSLISEKNAAASPDDLRAIIANGKGGMPRFGGKIAAADLDALVQQIKTANTK
ncbi:MAG: cytochrome c [Terriglobales bacterium]